MIGFISAIGVGFLFSRAISNALNRIADGLAHGADEIAQASQQIAGSRRAISSSARQLSAQADTMRQMSRELFATVRGEEGRRAA